MQDNNKSEPATKGDLIDGLTGLKTELKLDIAALDKKIGSIETGLNKKIDSVEQKLTSRIDSVETGLNKKIDSVKTELNEKIDSVEQRLDQKIEKVYMSQIQADSNLEKKMDIMMGKVDKFHNAIMSAFEITIFKGEKYDQKALTHADMLMEQGEKILNHETRITLLETGK